MTSEQTRTEFSVLAIDSPTVALRCAPELGGRVFSVINRRSGREWLWRRRGERELFQPSDPSDFGSGCFAGLDECVPSVGACVWIDGRKVADHGAFWARAWTVDHQSADGFTLSTYTPEFGLRLTRSLRVEQSTVRFDYTLTNTSSEAAPALWCMHPLFTLEEGDRLDLPQHVKTLRVQGVQPALSAMTGGAPPAAGDRRPTISFPEMIPGVRLDELMLADNAAGYLKAFTAAYPNAIGTAALCNAKTGDRLDVGWDARAAPYLGVWLTRGGYRGWHHVALEPTNAPHDRVDVAANDSTCAAAVTLAPGERRSWWVEWRVT